MRLRGCLLHLVLSFALRAATFVAPVARQQHHHTTLRRAQQLRLCAPLTVAKYGPASLHISLDGTRLIQTSLPAQPRNSVRIVFVSDTHSQLDDICIPDGDILCHTGDITFCASGGLSSLQVCAPR